MVRFKVVKGSQLLLYAAVIILAAVIGIVLFSEISGDKNGTTATSMKQADTKMNEEAKTNAVFASSSLDDRLLLAPDDGLSIEILKKEPSPVPTVLIYHTHTHEAYEQLESKPYVAIEAWRTTDTEHSIVRVGAELALLLRDRGFYVVHDTTDHEQNELGTAYTRSLETLQSYEKPFDLYIDLHRDACAEGKKTENTITNDQDLAQLLLLIGNGEGFEEKPYYNENLAFAEALTDRINRERPSLCKDVLVKDGRYNQNAGVFSILIEVGHNRNTLQQALNSLPYLADALQSLMITEPDERLLEMQYEYRTQS